MRIPLPAFISTVERMGPAYRHAALLGVRSAAYRLEFMVVDAIKDTKPYVPEDTGDMTRSTKTIPTEKGAMVVVDAPHAQYMEYGTRPHPVSDKGFQALMEWAIRKGLADDDEEAARIAWFIRKKINACGSKPRYFMARAVAEFRRQGILREEVVEELKRLGLTF